MPLDGIVVKSIEKELNENILNAKVEKVFQPEKDELLIHIRSFSSSFKLLLSCNPNYPRIHFTNIAKENPQTPPMFCMLLRKYLIGGKIIDIVQPELERIIELHIQSPNMLGDLVIYKLIIEMMGKHSNIILVDEESKIIDSIKHITHEVSRIREVLPGAKYFVPPTEKTNPLSVDFTSFEKLSEDVPSPLLPKTIVNNFMGMSTLIANEINNRYVLMDCGENCIDIQCLWDVFSKLTDKIKSTTFSPTIFIDPETEKYFDFSVMDIIQYANFVKYTSTSVSEIIEKFYMEKDQKDRVRQKTEDLRKHLSLLLDRAIRKYERLEDKLRESKDKDKFKIFGELILSNIHNIEKGQKSVDVLNYYSEAMETTSIPLDDQLSPSQNAQKYFKNYNKLKNAEETSLELIIQTKDEINYLESVLDMLGNPLTDADIEEVKLELAQEGYLKSAGSNKKKATVKSKPMTFVSSDGFTIFVGKNNIQNDELTLKIASKNDLWFHTKHIHGSHVIVKTDNNNVPDTTLVEAASLAAYYSKARESSNVQVDYTTVKNVKKPSGAKPGMVIYENYKTIVVNPKPSIN